MDIRIARLITLAPHFRPRPPKYVDGLERFITAWLANAPREHDVWTNERQAHIDFVARTLLQFIQFRPSATVAAVLNPSPWDYRRIEITNGPAEDELANEADVVKLVRVLHRLASADPPPTAPVVDAAAFEPRDGDGWEAAVVSQGVRIPYGYFGQDYFDTTHWDLCRLEWKTGTCEDCGQQGPTQLHHPDYRCLGQEHRDDLEELCNDCHRERHYPRRKAA